MPTANFCFEMVITENLNILHIWIPTIVFLNNKQKQIPWSLVRERTIPTESPPLVGEVSANFCG
jgi:hypothetical protein